MTDYEERPDENGDCSASEAKDREGMSSGSVLMMSLMIFCLTMSLELIVGSGNYVMAVVLSFVSAAATAFGMVIYQSVRGNADARRESDDDNA